MDSIAAIIIVVVGIPLILLFWLIARAIDARQRAEELDRRVKHLEADMARLKAAAVDELLERRPSKPEPQPVALPVIPPPIIEAAPPPPLPAPPFKPALEWPEPPKSSVPPPVPEPEEDREPDFAAFFGKKAPNINWEQFMGVKMFAWVGGLALFIGVSFFVKYSFDNNLVPPSLRAALGFFLGLGLLVGGIRMSAKTYPTLSQTLCATGIVILYAVTFACRALYHFSFFGPLQTFLLMALVTTTAFLLAIRLEAMVVAILGMLGGFLTPVMLSTGQDNPLGLFGYIAFLDAGLILVALNRRWIFLTALAAGATALMQAGWAAKFFVAGHYFDSNKIFLVFGVLVLFQLLYLAACGWARRKNQESPWLTGSGLGLAAIALLFCAWFLSFPSLANRPWVLLSFIILIDVIAAAFTTLNLNFAPAQPVAGLAVFALLGYWTGNSLDAATMNAGLVFYFIFAIGHAVYPMVLQRRFGTRTSAWAGHVFPALALLLVLVPIFKFAEVSFIVWPFVLLVDLLAMTIAVISGSLISVLAVLILTLTAVGALVFKIPAEMTGVPLPFFLLGVFALFFVAAGVWMMRKFKSLTAASETRAPVANLSAELPVFSAVLPFLLLIMAAQRLALPNPSPLFGLGLFLVILLLGVAKIMSVDALPAVGLVCMVATECSWHFSHFDPAMATVPLVWYLIFFAVFTLYPFRILASTAG